MRTFSSVIAALLISQAAMAAPAPTPSPSPSVVQVTPSTMPAQMLTGNYSILNGLNAVYQSKHTLDAARASLLPGGKIGAILDVTKSPMSFGLDSVSILLPFLLPSQWFAEKESSHMLDAEKDAYYILELNEFATVYSMYETIINDMDLEVALQKQYDDLNSVADILRARQRAVGGNPSEDQKQAEGSALSAKGQLEAMQELLIQEESNLSEDLGLTPGMPMNFDTTAHVQASTAEGNTLAVLLPQADKIAPEAAQINALIAASKDQKWSDVFAFLNAFSLDAGSSGTTGSTSSSTSTSFGDIGLSASVSFGFSTFPTVALDNEKTKALQLELYNLNLTEGQILVSGLGSITSAQAQVDDYSASEAALNEVFEIEKYNYKLGLTDLLHVLDADSAAVLASVSRIKAQSDLDNQRIDLHRVFLTDQFAALPPCQFKGNGKKSKSNPFGWIVQIFSGKAADKSIDQLCRPGL
jgi:outer membrane protein, multidrug efflux system